uniref:Holin n=1 Tax=Streptomyces phage Scarif TaxID=3158858 RepID=A0AAU7GX93_9CAUD
MSSIENNEETQTSAVRKAANLANDAIIITTVVVSVVGLGKLAYDTAEVGIDKFKTWKKNRKNKTEA